MKSAQRDTNTAHWL